MNLAFIVFSYLVIAFLIHQAQDLHAQTVNSFKLRNESF